MFLTDLNFHACMKREFTFTQVDSNDKNKSNWYKKSPLMTSQATCEILSLIRCYVNKWTAVIESET